MSNRAELIKKLEVLIADPAASPGEKEAAKARLAAIKSKYVSMTDAEIFARLETLLVEIKQLKLKNEEMRVVKAEGVKRYKALLKTMTDKEVNDEWSDAIREAKRNVECHTHRTWKLAHAASESIRRYRQKVKTMTDAELEAAKMNAYGTFEGFITAEIEKRQRRRR
jgi:hypothetical protein